MSVRSGLGKFFAPEPEHAICHTESWCVAQGWRWGVVRSECEQQMSAGQYLTPAPCTQQTGRRATDHPSTLLLMTLEFQEPAIAITPTATHEAIPPSLPSSSAWTGKMLSGQITDQTMRDCDTELKLPCFNVRC